MNPTEKVLFRIDYDGRWFHDGDEIKRAALVKLFADRGLRRDEAGGYWLQSPESRYPVTVEDVPFVIVDYDISNPGPDQSITLTTGTGEVITLDDTRRLDMRPEPRTGVMVPYVNIRPGLDARLGRAVFYKLVGLGYHNDDMLVIDSNHTAHPLGHIDRTE